MKRVLCGVLAVVLALSCFVGCQKKSAAKTFETISITFEDGKSVDTNMDMDTVRKIMGDSPDNTLETEYSITDEWYYYGISAEYRDEKADRFHVYPIMYGTHFSTSLGVSLGDSVASLKEKLGEKMEIDAEEDKYPTDYQYGFILEDGRYTLFNGTFEEFVSSLSEESGQLSLYMATFGTENDKVDSFSIYKFP